MPAQSKAKKELSDSSQQLADALKKTMMSKNKIDAQKIVFKDIEKIAKEIYPILSKMEGKKLLITGAAGMVPSYFLDTIFYLNKNRFVKKTTAVCFVHRKLTQESRLWYLKRSPWFTFKVVDLAKPFTINGTFDYIIHAASKASPKEYMANPIETMQTNVMGTAAILEYIKHRKNCKLLLFSSGEVYGNPAIAAIDERYVGAVNHLSERACYGEAKRFAETLCYGYAKKFGITVSVARLFHTFGPGIKKGDSRIWSAVIFKALENKNIEIMDTATKRCLCYTADAIKQLWYALLCGKGFTLYNIGNPKETAIGEFANLVKKISGAESTIIYRKKHMGAWKNSPRRTCPNVRKILKESKIKITTSTEESIRRTITWCRKFYGYQNREIEQSGLRDGALFGK